MDDPDDPTLEGPRAPVDSDYDASSITVLEGLEPVRERPGMYIGSKGPDGLHHMVYEVVDNAIDEAMAGHCTEIDITLNQDGSCTVSDDGRGIPVDSHPSHPGTSAAEIVLTVLHAGGKFGGGGYKVSGGLHGVGVSVVNALSEHLEAVIDRDGRRYVMRFHNGGELISPLHDSGPSPQGRTGTTVSFVPDGTIMEATEFDAEILRTRFRTMAFLNAGVSIRFCDKRQDQNASPDVFSFPGGLEDFVEYLNSQDDALFDSVGRIEGAEGGDSVDLAFQWTAGFRPDGLRTFANGVSTTEGGMHAEGFKSALTSAVNTYAASKAQSKNGQSDPFTGDDIREGLTAVLSVKMEQPQFEGQTKTKLGNTSMRSLVQRVVYSGLREWLEEHPTEARAIIAKASSAQKARLAAQKARSKVRKSALGGAGLPGKLTDCSSDDPDETELYIVEGDSAGGSAKEARDPATMAILPIRGKILNVNRATQDRAAANREIQALITAIGAGADDYPDHPDFDIEKVRYKKVVLLCDADVDGSHIRILLLTFFFKSMLPLLINGCVYIAQPPLYSTKVGTSSTVYLKDDRAKDEFLKARPNHRNEFQRLKGLGEMDASELWDTTMNPDDRTFLRVTLEEAETASKVFETLMGEDVSLRKAFIQDNAADVRFLDV